MIAETIGPVTESVGQPRIFHAEGIGPQLAEAGLGQHVGDRLREDYCGLESVQSA